MDVNAYILRAVLARQDLDDEGAVNVGTSTKANLNNAVTVEEALRAINERGEDPSGFSSFFPTTVSLGFDPPPPIQGAGITVINTGPSPKIHAKGRINFSFTDIGGLEFMDFENHNMFAMTLTADKVLRIMNTIPNQRFSIRIEQDSVGGRIVVWFPGIHWANGVEPSLNENPARADWFGFIKLDDTPRYEGFVIGNNLS